MVEDITVKIDGKDHKVKVEESEDGKIKVHMENETIEVHTKTETVEEQNAELDEAKEKTIGDKIIRSPLPGTVFDVLLKEGDHVKKGQSAVKIVAMKMENDIVSPSEGIVKSIKVKKDDAVEKGQVLIELE